MARPTMKYATAGTNITADMWNDNFDGIMTYADDAVDEIKELAEEVSKTSWYPIGCVFSVVCTSSYVPGGSLPCDGGEYSASQFNDLWENYLTTSTPKLQTCTYTEYENSITAYGSCAKFAIDTTNNTFKVPTIKDGAYITQAKSDSELGKSYNESLPNHTHGYKFTTNTGDYAASGSGSSKFMSGSNSVIQTTEVTDTESNVWQDNAKVQGDNVRLRYFVQVANAQANTSEMDWAQWASGLSVRANTDLSNITDTAISTIKSYLEIFPDLTIGISVSSGYTATSSGWIYLENYEAGSTGAAYIDGVKIFKHYVEAGAGASTVSCFVPIFKGQVLTYSGRSFDTVKFYPNKQGV